MVFESGQFDLNRLSQRIDATRTERHISWSQISQEVGVSASTIRRFATATDAEADGVLALIEWLGVPPEHFVVNSKVAGVLLPPPRNGTIRIDMSRLAELPAWPRRTPTGTRTTIQRLAATRLATRAASGSRSRTGRVDVASVTVR